MPDLVGEKFGKLLVVEFSHINRWRAACFLCKCECGNSKIIATNYLNSKKYPARTCGECSKYEMIGKKFGKIVVLRFLRNDNRNYRLFECRCDCGNIVERSSSYLEKSRVVSCGECYKFDMIGKVFSNLKILKFAGKKGKYSYFECLCKCGNIKEIAGFSIKNMNSCGECFKNEIVGNKYNRLRVLKFSHTSNKVSYFECKCDCGSTVIKSGRQIKSGHIKSCGECFKTDLNGKIFGKLKVIRYAHTKGKRVCYECLCECGNITIVSKTNLIQENTNSCGCIKSLGESKLSTVLHEILGEWGQTIRPNWLKNPKTGKNLEIDLYFPSIKLAVEYNGAQHYRPINFCKEMNPEDNLKNIKDRDKIKKKLIKKSKKIKNFVIFTYRDRITEESVRRKLQNIGVI